MFKKCMLFFPVVFLFACAPNVEISSDQPGQKQKIGTLSGMIIGGALANDMAEGSKNKGIATILGAFVGGTIGQNIGAQLDERDRLLAERLTRLRLSTILAIRRQSGKTQTVETMVGSYLLALTVKMEGIVENSIRKYLLAVKNKQATAEPVDSLTVHGKLLAKIF